MYIIIYVCDLTFKVSGLHLQVFYYSSSFNVEFKTKAATGVLFYVSDENHQDFMALYIEGGMVDYDFNCGSGAARITSLLEYNDDQWHTVSNNLYYFTSK